MNKFAIPRSTRPEVFLKKGALKICSKFIGEHPCRVVISIKLLCNFTEITLLHGCSPVNLLHIFGTLLSKNTSGRLLLHNLIMQNIKPISMVSFAFYLIWEFFVVKGLGFDPCKNGVICNFIFYFILYIFINSIQFIVYTFVYCKMYLKIRFFYQIKSSCYYYMGENSLQLFSQNTTS